MATLSSCGQANKPRHSTSKHAQRPQAFDSSQCNHLHTKDANKPQSLAPHQEYMPATPTEPTTHLCSSYRRCTGTYPNRTLHIQPPQLFPTDHPLVQLLPQVQQLLALRLLQARHGDARPARHHARDLLGAHHLRQHRVTRRLSLQRLQARVAVGQRAVPAGIRGERGCVARGDDGSWQE